MTKIIGLTGGIGSGKTTIAHYLAQKGIPVYISDVEAKKVMKHPAVIDAIKKAFGATIYDGDELNRVKLAEIVFNTPERLANLNSIVHPAVKLDFKEWLARNKEHELVVYESAILFESGSYKDFDITIAVTAPVEIRVERVLTRDKTTKDQIIKRINAQWTDEQRVSKSDFVIENIDFEKAKSQVDDILKILRIKQNES